MSGSGYNIFAVVGAGNIGGFITRQLLEEKSAGNIKEVVVLTRQESKATIEGNAKVIPVDYNNHESIKNALAGVDVVISTIAIPALKVQDRIVKAAKAAGVKLFVPSEFGGTTEGETEGFFGEKATIQDQLKALDLPYAVFYTGSFSDYIWDELLDLDVTTGRVSVGGEGDRQLPYTSRSDVARYVSYVLTHLPPEQLKNRTFRIAGDTKSFNNIFIEYDAKTRRKTEVTKIPVSVYEAKLAANRQDLASYLHKIWATDGPFTETDNHLYPNWNPSSVVDNMPVA